MEKKLSIKPIHFTVFWLCLNLLQAAFTQLTSDEGYYWFYTRSLEWGYYDHPPFLALLIKTGYSIFPNEFGVRVLYVILNTMGLHLLFRMVDPNDVKRHHLIYGIALSLPLFNYLAFLVFPDGPFLFFSMVFLTGYKRFITKKDWASVVILAASTALMMYSKYHGVLIVGFTVLSNIKLLWSLRFYVAMLLAFVLFVPHIWWQYTHDFATFQYHLKGRTSPLGFKHVFEYISQQAAAIGPGLIFIPFVYKWKDQLEKALLFIIVGSFGFFLFSSFKNFIHFHWTSLALFPLVLIASAYYQYTNKIKLFRWLVLPFVFFVLIFRLQLALRIFPVNNVGIDYYHGRDLWAQDIKQAAGGRPVFFRDNFRESSLYSFYSGQTGVSLQSGEKRRSQYEIWGYEDSLQHREVMLVRDGPFGGGHLLKTRMGKDVYYTVIRDFISYYTVPMEVDFPQAVKDQKQITVEPMLINNRNRVIHFQQDSAGNAPTLFYSVKKNDKEVARGIAYAFLPKDSIAPNGTLPLKVTVPLTHLPKGKYSIGIGISSPPLDDAYNWTGSFEKD